MFEFGLSYSHILVIAILAVIAIGPKDLPVVLRRFGQFMNKARGMAREFQGHVDVAMRDAGMADIKKDLQNIKSGIDTQISVPPVAKAGSQGLGSLEQKTTHQISDEYNKFFGSENLGGETRVAGRAVIETAA